MDTYQGTKTVKAEPMTRTDAEKLLGREIEPATPGNEGYLVEYPDGYKSWSPKEVFENTYKVISTPLDRMYREIDELVERFNKLDAFMKTDKFLALPPDIDGLLEIQYGAMMAYNHALQLRAAKMKEPEPKQ